MLRQRSSRSAPLLASLALLLLMGLGPAPPAPAAAPDSAAPPAGGTPRAAAPGPRRAAPAATDSARRAYRAWRARVRAHALADSIARADSLMRADSLTRALAPPPRDYVADVRASFTPATRAYTTTRAALGFLEPLYGILLGLFVLFSGLSAWMRDRARQASRHAYLQTLVYLALYLAVGFVLEFPLTLYSGFALERRYGLLSQSFGPWLLDEIKGVLLFLAFFGVVPLVRLAYLPIHRFPRNWWLVLGLGALPVILVGTFVQPLLVEPLFNRFTPLADKRLESRILEVAHRAGIPARRVVEMDASRQSHRYNAYISGFGASQRIVLWDNTLKGMTADEILFVVGHEAGHYRLRHVWRGIVFDTGVSFLVFALSAALARGAMARWGQRWGFTELHDLASMPLLVVALTFSTFLAQPGMNGWTQRLERDADTFGLELTRTNDAAARAFLKLGAQNRADPEPAPLIEFFEYSHPPLLERVRFALSYRPWEEGRPNRLYHAGR